MRTAILSVALISLALSSRAADFSRASSFESVAAFVAAAKAFQPASTKSDLSGLFSVRDRGPSEEPTRVTASTIESATELWSDDAHAVVFVTAAPATEATRSSVGALFLLVRDVVRLVATGKYAKVSAELTAFAGSGYQLGSEHMDPVITVTEFQGGRGYSYHLSASYNLNASTWNDRNASVNRLFRFSQSHAAASFVEIIATDD